MTIYFNGEETLHCWYEKIKAFGVPEYIKLSPLVYEICCRKIVNSSLFISSSGNEFGPLEDNTGRMAFYILSGFYQVSMTPFYFIFFFFVT